jgi:hypothetical protein
VRYDRHPRPAVPHRGRDGHRRRAEHPAPARHHPETVALARRELAEHGPSALADSVTTAVIVGIIAGQLQRSTGDTTAAMERALAGFDEAVEARATATVAQLDGLLARVDATETATRQAATDVLAALPTRIEQGLTTVLTGGAGNVREAVRQAVATAQAEALAQLEQVVRSHTAEVPQRRQHREPQLAHHGAAQGSHRDRR